jgi:crotonobetainyl-CoA:carnitine CoA-transferase CaiB-like acyl-CoA transferase
LSLPRALENIRVVDFSTSGNFNDTNVNKKSLSLNVRSAKGLEIVKRLIAISDIVIENFSSRVLQNSR